jgi:hypothetical protein
VKVRISLAGGDQAAELESLSDWLRGEPHQSVTVTHKSEPEPPPHVRSIGVRPGCAAHHRMISRLQLAKGEPGDEHKIIKCSVRSDVS